MSTYYTTIHQIVSLISSISSIPVYLGGKLHSYIRNNLLSPYEGKIGFTHMAGLGSSQSQSSMESYSHNAKSKL